MYKNKIRKLRKIVVDDHEYKWMVDYAYHSKRLRIWRSKTDMIYEHVDGQEQEIEIMGKKDWPISNELKPSDIELIIRTIT